MREKEEGVTPEGGGERVKTVLCFAYNNAE